MSLFLPDRHARRRGVYYLFRKISLFTYVEDVSLTKTYFACTLLSWLTVIQCLVFYEMKKKKKKKHREWFSVANVLLYCIQIFIFHLIRMKFEFLRVEKKTWKVIFSLRCVARPRVFSQGCDAECKVSTLRTTIQHYIYVFF